MMTGTASFPVMTKVLIFVRRKTGSKVGATSFGKHGRLLERKYGASHVSRMKTENICPGLAGITGEYDETL